MKILGKEPAVFLNVLASGVALLVALGVLDWTNEQTGYLMIAVAAVVAVGTAYLTKDVTLGVLIGAAEAIFAAFMAFGVELRPELTAGIIGLVTTVFGLFQRTQTTPMRGFGTETN
jgi:hypothetical protein